MRRVLICNHEQAIAADTDTDEPAVTSFTDISVNTQSVAWAVEVDYCCLCIDLGEVALQKLCDVTRERRRRLIGIDLTSPVVLTPKGDPA